MFKSDLNIPLITENQTSRINSDSRIKLLVQILTQAGGRCRGDSVLLGACIVNWSEVGVDVGCFSSFQGPGEGDPILIHGNVDKGSGSYCLTNSLLHITIFLNCHLRVLPTFQRLDFVGSAWSR